jgi:lysophospholipase L1-like esterase
MRLIILSVTIAATLSISCRHKQQLVNPDIYQNERTELFKSLPKDSGAVFLLGNSLMSEYLAQDFFHGVTLHNWGVSGSETRNTLQRVDGIIERKPSKVFVLDGINDIKNGVPFDTALKRYKQIVQKLHGTNYYLLSVLPTTGQYSKLNSDVLRFNDSIKTLGKYIDLYSHFVKSGEMNLDCTYDGLHLTGKGYSIMTEVLQNYIYGK